MYRDAYALSSLRDGFVTSNVTPEPEDDKYEEKEHVPFGFTPRKQHEEDELRPYGFYQRKKHENKESSQ